MEIFQIALQKVKLQTPIHQLFSHYILFLEQFLVTYIMEFHRK